jgi:hypothetical protein
LASSLFQGQRLNIRNPQLPTKANLVISVPDLSLFHLIVTIITIVIMINIIILILLLGIIVIIIVLGPKVKHPKSSTADKSKPRNFRS